MNRKDYAKNKIMYALQKIDYHKARMTKKKPDNLLSKVYFIMENYSKIDYLTLTRVFKDIPEAKIRKAVKYLNDLGVLDWDGKKLTNSKMVRLEQKDYATFVKDLEEKMKKKSGKNRLNLKEISDLFDKADKGEQPKQVKQTKTVETKDEQWVEIEYSQDVIMKVKKSKLKKLLE